MDHLPTAVGDLELLSRTANDDKTAFDELYQRYSRPLYHYLLRLIHEQHVAEDLLQEVFIAVWQGARGYRGQAQVKTWLYRIAHNRAISWLRRYKVTTILEDVVETSREVGPEESAIGSWQNDQIRQAVNQLPFKHQEVLELAFVHELSYTEIANVIGCPVGTVKSRMSYALRMLNGLLNRMNFTPLHE